MGGSYNMNGADEKYKILAGKPKGKKTLRRSSRRWEDNIKMDLKHDVIVNWIHLLEATDQWRAFVNMIMKLRDP